MLRNEAQRFNFCFIVGIFKQNVEKKEENDLRRRQVFKKWCYLKSQVLLELKSTTEAANISLKSDIADFLEIDIIYFLKFGQSIFGFGISGTAFTRAASACRERGVS